MAMEASTGYLWVVITGGIGLLRTRIPLSDRSQCYSDEGADLLMGTDVRLFWLIMIRTGVFVDVLSLPLYNHVIASCDDIFALPR